ncbi:Fatty acid oxidation complex subunit alpha [Streptomyces sp. RB5]|uniref:Fatty acid oxidation complex subunit alpha n=1 Tax=Streptomyces smaragdinus TaxID=2585196 RepID=A0A7K0CLS5_9ACTN|nr:enoyl-CoA hydratase [Streptomyces smaragdinus]MQY14436.1 Fatty acid oxidation complex subunit alpha [Streptomyces smaragdinus]
MTKVDLVEDDGRWTLTLDDPDRRNCLDEAMCRELGEAVAAVGAAKDARTLVVTGAGTSFCAGADLPALFGTEGRDVPETRRHLHQVYDSFLRLRALTIPTIAAVQGHAVGAGLNLAMACDVRIAGPRASFAATFTRIGLHPGGGCTYFLVDALGPQKALALLLDGGALDAEAAVREGIALRVADDPVAEAHETAARWAGLDADLVRDIKSAVGMAQTAGFDATLEFESWAQAASATGPAIQEAVARFRK